jgi:hypothetical protein
LLEHLQRGRCQCHESHNQRREAKHILVDAIEARIAGVVSLIAHGEAVKAGESK